MDKNAGLLDITVPFSAIKSLDRPRDSSRNGALIGASIGGGFVLGMFAWALSVDRNEFDEWGVSRDGDDLLTGGRVQRSSSGARRRGVVIPPVPVRPRTARWISVGTAALLISRLV